MKNAQRYTARKGKRGVPKIQESPDSKEYSIHPRLWEKEMKMNRNLPLVLFCFSFLAAAMLGCSAKREKVTRITEPVGFQHLGGYLAKPPALDDGFLYSATGAGSVHKLDWKSGEILWTCDKVGCSINNTPVLTQESVIVIGSKGKLFAIDKVNGEKRWERPENGWTLDGKNVELAQVQGCFSYDSSSSTIVLGDSEGKVFAIHPEDGSLKWFRELNDKIVAPPCFQGERCLSLHHAGKDPFPQRPGWFGFLGGPKSDCNRRKGIQTASG